MSPLRYIARWNPKADRFHVELGSTDYRLIQYMDATELERFCAQLETGRLELAGHLIFLDPEHYGRELDSARLYFWMILEGRRAWSNRSK